MLLTDRSHERERLVERIDMGGVADKFGLFFDERIVGRIVGRSIEREARQGYQRSETTTL